MGLHPWVNTRLRPTGAAWGTQSLCTRRTTSTEQSLQSAYGAWGTQKPACEVLLSSHPNACGPCYRVQETLCALSLRRVAAAEQSLQSPVILVIVQQYIVGALQPWACIPREFESAKWAHCSLGLASHVRMEHFLLAPGNICARNQASVYRQEAQCPSKPSS